jgi:hypothetical protein
MEKKVDILPGATGLFWTDMGTGMMLASHAVARSIYSLPLLCTDPEQHDPEQDVGEPKRVMAQGTHTLFW